MGLNVWGGLNTWGSGGGIPPQGTVTVTNVTPTTTTANVSFIYSDTDETGFDYRLNGGPPVDILTANPFVITSLTEDTSYTVEVRAYNGDGDGAWSASFPFTTMQSSVIEWIVCFNGSIEQLEFNGSVGQLEFNGFILTGC